jgi:hypothetical protein
MKDFLKIFAILCGFVGAFLYGRSYGEQTFKQSEEYLQFVKAKDEQIFLKNDIENAKAKLQNIIDGSENKKSDELLAQIFQIFLADLGLKIQNQQTLKENLTAAKIPVEKNKAISAPEGAPAVNKLDSSEEPKLKLPKAFNYKKLKSYEWILMNAQGSEDIAGNLKNLEIKNMDSYMSEALVTRPEDESLLMGSYRGRIMDVTNKEYGTFVFEMGPSSEDGKDKFKGSITLFRNGRKESVNSFSGTSLGYRFESSAGTVINFGNNYYQMYKIPQTQQIAGFYYERLVNGTTKTIGSFVLNRVDQF